MALCECIRPTMCTRCRDELYETLGGAAALRGENLADRVARATPNREPWPDTPRAREVELGAVVDLASDAILRERFAREAGKWARRRWEEIRAGAPVRTPTPKRERR